MEAFKNIGAGIGNIIKGIGDLFASLVEKISGLVIQHQKLDLYLAVFLQKFQRNSKLSLKNLNQP